MLQLVWRWTHQLEFVWVDVILSCIFFNFLHLGISAGAFGRSGCGFTSQQFAPIYIFASTNHSFYLNRASVSCLSPSFDVIWRCKSVNLQMRRCENVVPVQCLMSTVHALRLTDSDGASWLKSQNADLTLQNCARGSIKNLRQCPRYIFHLKAFSLCVRNDLHTNTPSVCSLQTKNTTEVLK